MLLHQSRFRAKSHALSRAAIRSTYSARGARGVDVTAPWPGKVPAPKNLSGVGSYSPNRSVPPPACRVIPWSADATPTFLLLQWGGDSAVGPDNA